jgi:hypothetical protein
VFMAPSDKVAPGSFFIAFYDSQGRSGGILTRLHTGGYSFTLYRVIQKDGPNFVGLYFKTGTSDKYDVNYV